MEHPIRFSIIVPTHERPDSLRRCLRALSSLQSPTGGFEVIVVDDGGRTPLDSIESEFCAALQLRIVKRQNGGPGAARNTGAAHARGQFLVFTADDCTPAPDWLIRFEQHFEAYPEHLIGGKIENGLPEELFSTCNHFVIEHLYEMFNKDPEDAGFFTPNNIALPASGLQRIGGFDEWLAGTGEDRDLCDRWRLHGMRMVWVDDAVVHHEHPQSFSGFLRQHYAYGRGSGRFHSRSHARSGGGRPLVPEKLSFYATLVSYPFNREPSLRSGLEASMLCLSQIANALGVFRERFFPTAERASDLPPAL